MNILVIGGAGYIGFSLIEALLKIQNVTSIKVYDNLQRRNFGFFFHDKFRNPRISFIEGELLDNLKLKNSLEGIDVVYHLAAVVSEPDKDIDSQKYEQVNHWGTALLAAEIAKAGIKKTIYASSVYIYGHSESTMDESFIPQPNSFYGISKFRGELQLQNYLEKGLFIYRIGNVYGYNPAIRFGTLLNRIVFDSKIQGKITILGDGSQIRPLISLNSLVQKLILPLTNKEMPSGIINSIDINLSINDIRDIMLEIDPQIEYVYVNRHIKMPSIRVENRGQPPKNIKMAEVKEAVKLFYDKLIL